MTSTQGNENIQPESLQFPIKEAVTIQQKLFSGNDTLFKQNNELNNLIQNNQKILKMTDDEYVKVKNLLRNYSIIKEKLTDDYIRNTQKLQTKYSKLRIDQENLEGNNKKLKEDSDKHQKEFKKLKTYIDKMEKPISKWAQALTILKNKEEGHEQKVTDMLKETGLNKQKIDEYWEIIKKMDALINKLNLTVDDVKGYMTNEQRTTKNVAEELTTLKKKLIKTTEQIGGKNLNKQIKLNKIKNDDFLKFLSNPIEYKIKSSNTSVNKMTGGMKSSKSLWLKDSSSYIFKNFTRKELNNIAHKWGIQNTKKYKNKSELSKALKLLMLYKGGMIKGKQNINIVCKNIDQITKNIKVKNMKNLLNNKLKNIIL
jgi:chromosome segregation ATPase